MVAAVSAEATSQVPGARDALRSWIADYEGMYGAAVEGLEDLRAYIDSAERIFSER